MDLKVNESKKIRENEEINTKDNMNTKKGKIIILIKKSK